jgi:hypothetical protein
MAASLAPAAGQARAQPSALALLDFGWGSLAAVSFRQQAEMHERAEPLHERRQILHELRQMC